MREATKKMANLHEGLLHEYYIQGKHSEAEPAIDRAVDLFPDNQYFKLFKGP